MKHSGTLKIEIQGPLDPLVKRRLFALRKTAAQALTMTMQDFHAQAVRQIRTTWEGGTKEEHSDAQRWQRAVEKSLRENWNRCLDRERDYRSGDDDRDVVCMRVTEPLTAETVDNILARFKGQHIKDLIACRSGFPSFNSGVAFYARSRACDISGTPDTARITLPLFGTGRKATGLALRVAGGSHRSIWRRLVAHSEERERIVALEGDGTKKSIAKLEAMRAMKMGRVGVTYNERRRKWFVTVSFSEYAPDATTKGQKAAVNFGVNVFMQALAEDGTTWPSKNGDHGDQIIHKRQAWNAARRRIQKNLRSFGRGSRGRGVKRRMLPLTKRRGDESNWVTTFIRQLAADLITWCKAHGVADLYIEDLADIRESFERQTEGQAHEEVKRRIHSWPFYETAQAIAREGSQRGVRVHLKSARYVSQRCPSPTCGHVAPENVTIAERQTGPVIERDGKRYRELGERWSRFECVKCGLKASADVVACANHLKDVGATHALEKQQSKARERIGKFKQSTREALKKGRAGNGSSNGSQTVQRASRGNSRGAKKRDRRGRHPVSPAP